MFLRHTVFVAFYASSPIALAGTVVFDPPQVQVHTGEIAQMEVWIGSSDLVDFDAVSILLGSDDGLPLDFETTYRVCPECFNPPSGFGIYTSDISVGGLDFSAPLFTAPLLVGTLFVDTSGFASGTYEIIVDPEEEVRRIGFELSLLANGFTQEQIEGRATITIIPEPTSLIALLLCCVGVRCRLRGI